MSEKPWFNNKVLNRLFGMKYLAFIVSLLLLITGIFAILFGAQIIFESILTIVNFEDHEAGLNLLEGCDILLFSLVILILSGGIYKLFVGDENTFQHISVFAKLKTFKDLKVLLWETILLSLTVGATLDFFLSDEPSYEQLILPAGILLLALALRVMVSGNFRSKKSSE